MKIKIDDMPENYQAHVYSLLTEPPILYNAGLARIIGSVKATIVLAQLLFWYGKGAKKGYVYKTIKEMQYETGLTRHEQISAIRDLKKLGIVSVSLQGIPAKRHFSVDVGRVMELITFGPDYVFKRGRTSGVAVSKKQTSNTENTSETTSHKKPEKKPTFKKRKLTDYERGQRVKVIKNRTEHLTNKMSVGKKLTLKSSK